jgi:PIN domain nuclease of toxin-antitoxin system
LGSGAPVKLLLDTHVFLWLVQNQGRLTDWEQHLIEDDETELLISPIVIWELRLKWNAVDRHGRRKGLLSPEQALSLIEMSTMRLVSLTGEQCAATLEPPIPHKDPFDEMLLVHAGQLGARLLTRDRLLVGHPLTITP